MTEEQAFWRYKFISFMKQNKMLAKWSMLYEHWSSSFSRHDFFTIIPPCDFITEVGYDVEEMKKLDSKWMQYICVLESKIQNRKIKLAFNEN